MFTRRTSFVSAVDRKISLVFLMVAGMMICGSVLYGVDSQKPEPEPCQMCHEAENYQWSFSVHAQSMNKIFLAEWETSGKDKECLSCHCGIYDAETGVLIEECVSCQDCHGPDNPDHPNEAKMKIPDSSDACQRCHGHTWGQWRISAHGQNNVRCFDCHEMHQNELLKEKADELCGSCHTKRLNDFAHSTHNISGLHCITCHMPKPEGVHTKIKGTGVPSHIFSVDAKPCAGCHHEMVHTGHEISTLKEKVGHLEEKDSE